MTKNDGNDQEMNDPTAFPGVQPLPAPGSEEVQQMGDADAPIAQGRDPMTAKKNGDRTPQTAARENKVRPDTSQIVSDIAQSIQRLEHAAISYRNRENFSFVLIFLATFGSTFIAGANLLLKQHVDLLGGWVLFCTVALLLNTAAGVLAGYVKATNPGRHKDRCLKFCGAFKKLKRELQAEDLTSTKFTSLKQKLERQENQAAEYLLPPSKPWVVIIGLFVIVVVVVAYFGLAGWHLASHAQPGGPSKPTPQSAPENAGNS